MEGRVLDADDEQKYWAEFSKTKSQKFKTTGQKKNKGKGTGFQRSGKRPASSNDSEIKAKRTVFKDEDEEETTNNHGENENAVTNDEKKSPVKEIKPEVETQ